MKGDGRCLKLFLALSILFLQKVKGGEVGYSHSHDLRDAKVTVRCIEKERQALLAFKRGLVDEFNQLSTWGSEAEKQDCCRWEGVYCSNQPGHVIQLDLGFSFPGKMIQRDIFGYSFQGKMISPKLIELQHLQYLDLEFIDFNGSQIPDFIGSLTNLRNLSLYSCNLVGQIPSSFGNLTQLQHLDLGHNQLQAENLNWLPAPSSLTYLDLALIDFNGSQIPYFIGSLTNLRNLSLYSCNLVGQIPISFGNLTQLQHLDLNGNKLQAENLNWLPAPSSLTYLNLALINFNGSQIPDFIGSLTNLRYLNLYYCHLVGQIPESIGQMSQLEDIDFSMNSLKGVVSETHFSKLSKLKYLDLSSNSKLVLNFHSDWVPPFHLSYIYLASCKVGPLFPKWLQTQNDSSHLDISNAGISDILPSWFWSNFGNADLIILSQNLISGIFTNLTVEFRYNVDLHLSSNQIEGPIPSTLSQASYLDLSNNNISGSLSFLCASADMSLTFLNLSSNSFFGELPDCWSHLETLVMLDLSNNAFSGKIPMTIGSLWGIETLKLRSNRFVGELPSSLKNCTSLEVIDLGENKLSGPIPTWLGVSYKNLVILMLSTNHFNGSMPSQLCHLTHIQIMDFSMNNISGSIPKCLNNLIALAQNGNPSLSSTHSYYIDRGDSVVGTNYEDDASFIWKGRMQTYKSTLGLVKRIDLSSNRLTGEIPSEITQLVGLISLNLSRNQLRGQITPEIGNLQSLDSLDLSRNQIDGGIPTSLARIDRLSFLDLSYNNLSGKIPTGTQLQGFDLSVYVGNPQLCGPPLKKMCVNQNEKTDLSNQEDHVGNPQLCGPPLKKMCVNQNEKTDLSNQEDQDELITLGFYISTGLGFAAGFWGVCGTLIFNRSWRYTYLKFLNSLNDWLYVRVALIKQQLKLAYA